MSKCKAVIGGKPGGGGGDAGNLTENTYGMGGAGGEHVDAPFRYDPTQDENVSDVPLRTTLASLLLGNQWRFSSGNDTPFFGNITEDICYQFPKGGVKNQAIPANQDISGIIPTKIRYHAPDLDPIQPNPTLGAGIVDYNVDNFPLPANLAVYGVSFFAGEVLNAGDVLYFSITEGFTGNKVYEQKKIIDVTSQAAIGQRVDFWFIHPSEAFALFTADNVIRKGSPDGPFVKALNSVEDPANPWAELQTREFEDETIPRNAELIFQTEKGAANGVAPLDSGSKIPAIHLPASAMEYKCSYDIVTNTPPLADGGGDLGDVYKCSTAGTRDFGSGNITVAIGDVLIYNCVDVYEKVGSEDLVQSVNGKIGIVVLDTDDVGEGTGNLYFTELRVTNTPAVLANSAKVSFPEAPVDGKQYTRKNGGWEENEGDPKHSTQALVFDATQDWDVSNGTMATLTLTANCTFDAPSNLEEGGEYVLILNTSTYNVTAWDSIFKWPAGNAPVLPVNSKVVIQFMYDGTDLMGVMNGGFA